MKTVGIIEDLTREFIFEWKIEDAFSLQDNCYRSPSFTFEEESWHLDIFPNGDSRNETVECVGVYLNRELCDPPKSLTWSFSVKTVNGRKAYEQHRTRVFAEIKEWGSSYFIRRSELLENKSKLLPSNILTIVCTIESCSKSMDVIGNILEAKCSYCNEDFANEYVSSHKEKCLEKPIQCPTCKDVVKLRKWFDHECELMITENKLVNDLKAILDSEDHSDLTIIVKDQELRLHRNILAGRNPYFKALLNTDMKEKTTGIITIDDCEPHVFHSFINFIYTGKVNKLCVENVSHLYKVSDRYQEDQLKTQCLGFMKKHMSIDTFCDFIVLALDHNEKDLLHNATELFCRKTKEIICSVKWQSFMKQYSTQANELYIKAVEYMSSKCTCASSDT